MTPSRLANEYFANNSCVVCHQMFAVIKRLPAHAGRAMQRRTIGSGAGGSGKFADGEPHFDNPCPDVVRNRPALTPPPNSQRPTRPSRSPLAPWDLRVWGPWCCVWCATLDTNSIRPLPRLLQLIPLSLRFAFFTADFLVGAGAWPRRPPLSVGHQGPRAR